ncbi:hypothetical protein DEI81_10770 [Curtobacterium sp. MCBD17_013]|uniref:toll/interleukin-1 receptor domain-containing protein n=1 Tax=Curtobacterium sp. MCBD17_013 TaxID=2175668 RepID=UPI000DA8C641|nr:toll/interleukin-1 receptor domain-containing protein [Curtobacterium sp. MCBD17_013]PZF61518.1 hypothetical protein DEI81_10770 [Curtobacterium sp. MCBD17_013]
MGEQELAERHFFISHDSFDHDVATVVKDVLLRAGVARTFLDVDDLQPGDPWQAKLRTALRTCDALVTLLTPEFSAKPWMAAEWASFWVADKTTYVLTLDVPLTDVFAPMTTSQLADLGSTSSMTSFLDAVAPRGLNNASLAGRLVERVAEARGQQRRTDGETLLRHVLEGEGVVYDSVLRRLIENGGAERLLQLGTTLTGSHLTTPRLFKVAMALLGTGTSPLELIPLTSSMGHSNYQRYVIEAVLALDTESEDTRRQFADSQFDALSEIAKRRVKGRAMALGFPLGPSWMDIEPFGM